MHIEKIRAEAKPVETVAFVLPCLNEARTIEWCVLRARQALDNLAESHGLSGEVIVADNGSTDGSQDIAERSGARVVPVARRGYGAALIGGFNASQATYLVMGDSDCSYDFVEGTLMVEKLINGADFCMGSRFKGQIKPGAMPWKNRYIGNPVLSGLLRLLFGTHISDSHCGLRAIRREAYQSLKLTSNGMEFASEMVLKAVLRGLTIAEVPVTLSPDGRGRPPHLNPWRDGLRHLAYMLLLSPRHLFLWPATAMLTFGLVIFALLFTAQDGQMANVGFLRFGDHWAVAASAAISIGSQMAIFGMFATIYAYQQGYRLPTPTSRWLLRQSRLERWLAIGFVLVLGGFIWAGSITFGWIASNFGTLEEIRSLIAAGTLIVAGFQIMFAGFFVSILAGNRSAHFHAV